MKSIFRTILTLLIAISPTLAESPRSKLSQNQTKALALIGKALKEANTIERELDRLRSLKFIARTQAKMGDLAEAMKTIGRIEKEATSEKTRAFCLPSAYSGIAYAQARSGDMTAAFATAEKGGSDFLEIISAQAETRGIAEAMQTVDTKIDGNKKDFALQNISRARAQISDFEGATQVADTIKSESSKEATYGSIAVIQARKGDSVGSQRSLAKVKNSLEAKSFAKAIADGPITEEKASTLPTAFERCDGYLNIAWILLDADGPKG
ncbi:MAG: hypothetical protein JWM59_3618 [Verrucomicrobiales bacterium]|nr:hypothetical protein [Verrucomicrobiales bacterium]